MVSVAKFLRRAKSMRRLVTGTTDRLFNKGLNRRTDGNLSKNLAYRIHFVPESGGNERVILHLVESNGSVGFEYAYKNDGKFTNFREEIRNSKIAELRDLGHTYKNVTFYPVLDLEDETIKNSIVRVRTARGKLAGKKEVIVRIPDEDFKKLKYDIIDQVNVSALRNKIGKAIKRGKNVKLNKTQKILLIRAVNVLKKTRGKALLSQKELSEDERYFVQHHVENHFKEHPEAGMVLLRRFGEDLKGISDIDTATMRLSSFFKENGIKVGPDQIRTWIRRVNKDKN